MPRQNRRSFLTASALAATALAVNASPSAAAEKKSLIHHVFFWLKNPESKEDLEALLKGLQTLRKIKTVKQIYIGLPAATEKRDVIDASYHASELLFFEDVAAQKAYQDDPIHLKFVSDCAHLWEKVVVYDTQQLF